MSEKVYIQLRVTPETRRALKLRAVATKRTMGEVVERLVEGLVSHQEKR